LATMEVPAIFDAVLDAAWAAARNVPGYLMENRPLLGTSRLRPAEGALVENRQLQGQVDGVLAKVAEHYRPGALWHRPAQFS